MLVAVKVSLPVFSAASRAVTVIVLSPSCNEMFDIVQLVVPEAVPVPPRLLVQVTLVAAMLSEALPPKFMASCSVEYASADVGDVIVTVGAVVSGRV